MPHDQKQPHTYLYQLYLFCLASLSGITITYHDMRSTVCVCMQDVVYFFQPQEDCLVTVATCNSAQFTDTFDTVLYVLSNAAGPAAMEVIGCNDDACSYLSQLQVSAVLVHETRLCRTKLSLTTIPKTMNQLLDGAMSINRPVTTAKQSRGETLEAAGIQHIELSKGIDFS